jgi:hypothetical protein
MADYIGYTVFDSSSSTASHMVNEIFLLYALALRNITREWRLDTVARHPEFPDDETEWPLLDQFLEDSTENSQSCAVGPTSGDHPLMTDQENAKQPKSAWKDLAISFNYRASNAFTNYGLEIVMMVHLAAAVARMDGLGLFYLLCLGVLLVTRRRILSKLWGVYLVFISILMIFQYLSALGYPPTVSAQPPWYSVNPLLLKAIGIPISAESLNLIPDFWLFMTCSFMLVVFAKDQMDGPIFAEWIHYERLIDSDFTNKPRY